MDSIELARQHARRLHDEAVQRGRNPWSPYEFAVGIANDLGITVETCAPGAALLDGSRASFDPDLPLIVHETKWSLQVIDDQWLCQPASAKWNRTSGNSPTTCRRGGMIQ